MDLLISPPSFHSDEINQEDLSNLLELPLAPLPESQPFNLPEEEPHNLPEEEPQSSTSWRNPETLPVSSDPDPETPCPIPENLPLSDETENLPLSDETYNKFIKSPTKAYNTRITEHNENLLKCSQSLIIIPTSIDMDESMPYIQEVLNNCPNPERDNFLKLERSLLTFLPLTIEKKTYLFLYTKVHYFDDHSYPDIYKSLKFARDQIIMSYPTMNEFSTSDFRNPFHHLILIRRD